MAGECDAIQSVCDAIQIVCDVANKVRVRTPNSGCDVTRIVCLALHIGCGFIYRGCDVISTEV